MEASSAEPTGDLPVGMDVNNSAAECMELVDEGSVGVVQVTAKKVAQIASAMKLTPEVKARLEAVLAKMDPLFHDEFVNMYKIMVPIFFKP